MDAKLQESSSSGDVWDKPQLPLIKLEDPLLFGCAVVAFIGTAIYIPTFRAFALMTLRFVALLLGLFGFFYLYINHGKTKEQPVVVQEAHDPNVMSITKYQWDDPGDINGIATIRIDTLPEKNNGKTTTIDWKDVDVHTVKVKADLVGEGLLVKVDTADGGKYQLKISKLYGDAAEVKIMIKPERLMVSTIYKKKKAVLAFRGGDASNLKAWPQPYRKV